MSVALSLDKQVQQFLVGNDQKQKPADNRTKAILFINIFTVTATIWSILFKLYVVPMGIDALEYSVWRNAAFFVGNYALARCLYNKKPFDKANWHG